MQTKGVGTLRFKKIYIEISNICNLRCSFCPGTKRDPRRMTTDEFIGILNKCKGYTEFLYFHLLGEPLCHPELAEFLKIAEEKQFKVIITTNGTLLKNQGDLLLRSPAVHKIVISLHSFEANDRKTPFFEYLDACFSFAKQAESNKIVVLRLWNNGGEDKLNAEILSHLENYFNKPWKDSRGGTAVGDKVFLQFGDKFNWPNTDAEATDQPLFCYGLRDQLGILCDGTVVPCCLDSEGTINLGNIFESDLESIITSKRATDLFNGFSNRTPTEELCRKCGYAKRF